MAVDDLSEHLQGVDAVIHAAAPLPGKGGPKALVKVIFLYEFVVIYL